MAKKENNGGVNEIRCSFCGTPKSQTRLLIAGISGHICDNCIGQAGQILAEEQRGFDKAKTNEKFNVQKPSQIKTYLDDYVIGQDQAKRVLAVAVYNHYKRLLHKSGKDEVELEKSNIMLVGPTGTGKTLLAKTIAKMLDVPFCIADATVLTEAGYVGEDVESVLTRLLQAADYDVARAEKGIVFIDEIDKIARKGDNASITRDVSGEGVQQALLKLLEGSVVGVPPQGGRKHPEQKLVQIDTRNILFVCGGAFADIDKIIKRRLRTAAVGYAASKDALHVEDEDLMQYISPMDLKSFGLIPELIGRFPSITYLNPLERSSLLRILTEPKNALIKQYVRLFELDKIKLSFDKEVLDFIVDKAIEFKLGARGLRSICEAILTQAMFDLPSSPDVKEFKVSLTYAMEQFGKSELSKLRVA
ncbi:MAG TPA: ATP-dependent Clp protease ATP-binding subunit ClpX [Luteibaculaceae bacterium]|nr:ATP-dependent Clp protease ATP-binding subunit ClpX [Luteibaculaceae bacterium]